VRWRRGSRTTDGLLRHRVRLILGHYGFLKIGQVCGKTTMAALVPGVFPTLA
jgi:hypothetical protein